MSNLYNKKAIKSIPDPQFFSIRTRNFVYEYFPKETKPKILGYLFYFEHLDPKFQNL